MTRLARRGAGLGVACALAVAALVVPAPRPRPRGYPITSDEQTFYGYYHLGQIHSSGYTGRGVTIGLVDGPVNTQIPELAGREHPVLQPLRRGVQRGQAGTTARLSPR